MKSIFINTVAMLFFAAAGCAFAQAVTAGPEVSYYMVIIATSSTPGSARGVQTSVLTFPSERACKAAAAVFAQPVDGANVVARCAPQR